MPSGSRLERSSNLQPVLCHQRRLLAPIIVPVNGTGAAVVALDEGGTSGIFLIEGGTRCGELAGAGAGDG